MTKLDEAKANFEAHFETCLLAEPRSFHRKHCTTGQLLAAAKYDETKAAAKNRAE